MVGRSFHYKFGVHFPGKMAQCIVFSPSLVPSGNSPADPLRSTGSIGIAVNPSKMGPSFPTQGSKMTVVFHKTPSKKHRGRLKAPAQKMWRRQIAAPFLADLSITCFQSRPNSLKSRLGHPKARFGINLNNCSIRCR